MRNLFFITLLFIAVCLNSCIKDNSSNIPVVDCSVVTTAAPSAEITTLKHYLDSSAISAVQDSRGFFYKMDSTVATDSGSHATVCSNIAVTYKGTFLNGTTFDSSNTAVELPLSNTILGWKEAVPLMKKNASITLYLPPSLAYGSAGYPPTIPGNAYLIFTITLYNFD